MPAITARSSLRLVSLIGLTLVVGCSSYETKWKAAAAQAAPADSIEGRWQGTWHSDPTNHSGGLRCIVTPTGPDAYYVDYHATYASILTFGYDMPVTVARRDGRIVYFKGSADLGWLAGGKYEYDGYATPTEYFCRYTADCDYGTFRLTRPAAQ